MKLGHTNTQAHTHTRNRIELNRITSELHLIYLDLIAECWMLNVIKMEIEISGMLTIEWLNFGQLEHKIIALIELRSLIAIKRNT